MEYQRGMKTMTRKFKVRFIAYTIDTDYRCCEAVIDL